MDFDYLLNGNIDLSAVEDANTPEALAAAAAAVPTTSDDLSFLDSLALPDDFGVLADTTMAPVAPPPIPWTPPSSRSTSRPKKRKRRFADLYDPQAPVIEGDPRLNPAPTSAPFLGSRHANAYAALEGTPSSTPAIEHVASAAAPGIISEQLLADMQQAVQLSAMLGAQQAAEAASANGAAVTPTSDVIAAAAAAAASAMAPYMMQLVQAHRAAGTTPGTPGVPVMQATELARVAEVGAPHVAKLKEPAPTQLSEAHKQALLAEERRQKRLERNRKAARANRQRYKHRVALIEKEMHRLVDRVHDLQIHQWGVNSVNRTGQLDSNMPLVEKDSAELLTKALSDPYQAYDEETDNWADRVAAVAKEAQLRSMSSAQRALQVKQSSAALRRSVTALQRAALSHMHLGWAGDPALHCQTCSKKCYKNGCTKGEMEAFRKRRLGTLEDIRGVLKLGEGVKLADASAPTVPAMETMRWLHKLGPCFNNFDKRVDDTVEVGSRLASALWSVLTPQQVEKLGVWLAENEHLLDSELDAKRRERGEATSGPPTPGASTPAWGRGAMAAAAAAAVKQEGRA